jgi:uncharacterized membrane protein YuzA (DUF378 family)
MGLQILEVGIAAVICVPIYFQSCVLAVVTAQNEACFLPRTSMACH